jgi:hypothetical protein
MATSKKIRSSAGAAKRALKGNILRPRKKPGTKKSPPPKKAPKKTIDKKKVTRKWSRHEDETSDSLDLEQGVFKGKDPKKIAQSLKRSAGKSRRRKATPFQSAMSMQNFYINRGGKNLLRTPM